MITKQINYNEFTQCIITGFRNGNYVCTLQKVENEEVVQEVKNLLFTDLSVLGITLNQGEEELLKGYSPIQAWNMTETRAWLAKENIEHTEQMTETELLALCPETQIVPELSKCDWTHRHLNCRVTVPKYSVLEGERYSGLASNLLKLSTPHELIGDNIRVYVPGISPDNAPTLEADPEVTIEYLN